MEDNNRSLQELEELMNQASYDQVIQEIGNEPKQPEELWYLCESYYVLENYDEMYEILRRFDRLVKSTQDFIRYCFYMGVSLHKFGDIEGARKSLQHGIEFLKFMPDPHLQEKFANYLPTVPQLPKS